MIVGAAAVELRVEGSRSLKEKRGVVRSVSQRVRNRFPVSVAEVGGQDTWTQAILGITTVGTDPVRVRRVLEQVVDFVEDLHLAELVAQDVEILRLPLSAGHGDDPDDEESLTSEDGSVASDAGVPGRDEDDPDEVG
jgi:uncharacterized protein YlxP (DUF503 family)